MRALSYRAGRSSTLIASLITVLTLSGCMQVDVSSEFHSDGSGVHAITSTVDRSMIEDDTLGGELDFAEIEESADTVDDLNVERIDDSERIGVRISTQVDDNTDLGSALNVLFNGMDPASEPVNAFEGSFTEVGARFGGSTYQFELDVDGDALFKESGDFNDEMDAEFSADMLRQVIDMTYTVSMPGELVDHNGTEISNGQIQWDLPFQGTSTFVAESEEGGGVSLTLIAGAGTGTLALVFFTVGGIILLRDRSTRADKTTPTGETTAF